MLAVIYGKIYMLRYQNGPTVLGHLPLVYLEVDYEVRIP